MRAVFFGGKQPSAAATTDDDDDGGGKSGERRRRRWRQRRVTKATTEVAAAAVVVAAAAANFARVFTVFSVAYTTIESLLSLRSRDCLSAVARAILCVYTAGKRRKKKTMSGYRKVNYYELCRLCTSSEGTKINIFRDEGRRRQLQTKIQTYLQVQVREKERESSGRAITPSTILFSLVANHSLTCQSCHFDVTRATRECSKNEMYVRDIRKSFLLSGCCYWFYLTVIAQISAKKQAK